MLDCVPSLPPPLKHRLRTVVDNEDLGTVPLPQLLLCLSCLCVCPTNVSVFWVHIGRHKGLL